MDTHVMPRSSSLLAPLFVVLAGTSACKTSSTAKPPENGGGGASDGRLFDGLFRAGASWRFEARSERTMWDDSDPEADASGNVTKKSTSTFACSVVTVRAFPGGRASEIQCDDGADTRASERIAGVWVQTADGLWHEQELPDEGVAPKLDPANRFLAAVPKAEHKEDVEPEGPDGPSGGSGSTLTIEGDGGSWCVQTASWGGDESWQRTCLDEEGPAGGGAGWAGGSSEEVVFERVPSTAAR